MVARLIEAVVTVSSLLLSLKSAFPIYFLLPLCLLLVWFPLRFRALVYPLSLLSVLLVLTEPMRSSSVKAGPSELLRVASVNINGYHAPQAKVTMNLLRLEPDILLLQEFWMPRPMADFEFRFPDFLFVGDPNRKLGSGGFVGSGLPTESAHVFGKRSVGQAWVSFGGVRILTISHHGKKYISNSLTDTPKNFELQLEQAARFSGRLPQLKGVPFILGADFNSLPSGPVPRELSRFLKPASAKAKSFPLATFPSIFPILHLDDIYYSPEHFELVSCRFVDVGSDHLAVVADFNVKKTESPPLRQGVWRSDENASGL